MNRIVFVVGIDRSEGGASIEDGSIEVMLHRRLLYDDSLGVGEALNESAYGQGLVVRGRHLLIAERPDASALLHRVGSQQLFMHPLATYALTNQTYTDYSNAYRQTWTALSTQLPLNLHLLTLDQLTAKDYLVRVENYFELNEDANYSHPFTFDLQSIFQAIGTISNTVELTLAANMNLADLKRLDWVTSEKEESSSMNFPRKFSSKDMIRLLKMVFFSYFRRHANSRYECHIESNANPNIPSDTGMRKK